MIESRDPFESVAAARRCELAIGLRACRQPRAPVPSPERRVPCVARAAATGSTRAKAGVSVFAEEFSLRERGIEAPARGVKAASLDAVLDQLEAGWSRDLGIRRNR